MAQLDARQTSDQEFAGSTPPSRQHYFVEVDRRIFTVILSFR